MSNRGNSSREEDLKFQDNLDNLASNSLLNPMVNQINLMAKQIKVLGNPIRVLGNQIKVMDNKVSLMAKPNLLVNRTLLLGSLLINLEVHQLRTNLGSKAKINLHNLVCSLNYSDQIAL